MDKIREGLKILAGARRRRLTMQQFVLQYVYVVSWECFTLFFSFFLRWNPTCKQLAMTTSWMVSLDLRMLNTLTYSKIPHIRT